MENKDNLVVRQYTYQRTLPSGLVRSYTSNKKYTVSGRGAGRNPEPNKKSLRKLIKSLNESECSLAINYINSLNSDSD